MIGGRGAPEQVPLTERTVKARFIEARKVAVVPRVIGYGSVQPGRVWEAVAEVAGAVISVHPSFKQGARLEAGDVLLRINPKDYELGILKAEARIKAIEADLAELNAGEANDRASLKIEKQVAGLAEKDLRRKQTLASRNAVSQAAIEQQEQAVLVQRQSVQRLQNALNLYPAKRLALQAGRAERETQLNSARLDLARTTITVPFDSRVAEKNVEPAQFVRQGDVLAVTDGIAVSEVLAQVPVDRVRYLFATALPGGPNAAAILSQPLDNLGIDAVVRLRTGDADISWAARFTRVNDTIDPETRTIGLIVEVDDTYRRAIPGVRPPLVKGMFVEVEFRAKPMTPAIIIPREAVNGGRVYVVNEDGRLTMRAVEIAFSQTNFVVLKSGVEDGEKIIVSDLIPAIEDMLLDPVPDAALASSIAAEARGEGPVR